MHCSLILLSTKFPLCILTYYQARGRKDAQQPAGSDPREEVMAQNRPEMLSHSNVKVRHALAGAELGNASSWDKSQQENKKLYIFMLLWGQAGVRREIYAWRNSN